jgi:lipopolysaccharide export LptBFGC system permease protein LptF
VASPYFHSVLENAVTQSGKNVFPFIKSQITYKGKYYNMWALNWNSDKNTKIIRSLKNNFNLFSNTNVSLKYENTTKLFNG